MVIKLFEHSNYTHQFACNGSFPKPRYELRQPNSTTAAAEAVYKNECWRRNDDEEKGQRALTDARPVALCRRGLQVVYGARLNKSQISELLDQQLVIGISPAAASKFGMIIKCEIPAIHSVT